MLRPGRLAPIKDKEAAEEHPNHSSGVSTSHLIYSPGLQQGQVFQADLLGIDVVRPAVTETTALGAAYLAGLSTGVYRNTDELADLWRVERRFVPGISRELAAQKMEQWEHAVRQAVL